MIRILTVWGFLLAREAELVFDLALPIQYFGGFEIRRSPIIERGEFDQSHLGQKLLGVVGCLWRGVVIRGHYFCLRFSYTRPCRVSHGEDPPDPELVGVAHWVRSVVQGLLALGLGNKRLCRCIE